MLQRREFIKTVITALIGLIAWPKKAKGKVIHKHSACGMTDFDNGLTSSSSPSISDDYGYQRGSCAPPCRSDMPEKRSGTKYIYKTGCNCKEQKLIKYDDRPRLLVICSNHEPYWLYYDGHTENLISKEAQEEIYSRSPAYYAWKEVQKAKYPDWMESRIKTNRRFRKCRCIKGHTKSSGRFKENSF